ncbi:MAG: hypothetical protein LBF43_03860 [Puniceicoccales bacterium]|nr:hypothetical protein [Puniceicoccales bacterium]
MKNVIQTIATVGFMMGTVNLNAWHCKVCNEEHPDDPSFCCPKNGTRYCPECGRTHVLSHCPMYQPIEWDKGGEVYVGVFQYLHWLDLHGSADDFEVILNLLNCAIGAKGGAVTISAEGALAIKQGEPTEGWATINGIDPKDFSICPQFNPVQSLCCVQNFNDDISDDPKAKVVVSEKGYEYLGWLNLYGSMDDYENALIMCINMAKSKGGDVATSERMGGFFVNTANRQTGARHSLPFVHKSCHKMGFENPHDVL